MTCSILKRRSSGFDCLSPDRSAGQTDNGRGTTGGKPSLSRPAGGPGGTFGAGLCPAQMLDRARLAPLVAPSDGVNHHYVTGRFTDQSPSNAAMQPYA
jgi:hypothetical protein